VSAKKGWYMAWARFGFGSPNDDQPIEAWMDDRDSQVAQRDALDAAGRDRWEASTRSGENLDASRPTDIVALGGASGSPSASAGGATGQDASADSPAGGGESVDQQDAASPSATRATVRYVKARQGDNITRLVGGSDPASIGAFARLNGMDGRNSTIYAGRAYRIPSGSDDVTDGDAALGGQLLRHDNAQLAALRAQRAANDQLLARLHASQDPWTEAPLGTTAQERPSPALASGGQPWWQSRPAKTVAGTVAYAGGALEGAPLAVVHAVGDIKDAGLFGLQWAGALGPQAQARANREARDAAGGVLRYAQAAVDHPSKVVSDLRGAAGNAVDSISPFNADMSGSLGDVWNHQLQHGRNFGEGVTNVAGMFVGGEVLQGLRAADAFEATRAARIEKFVDQGANPKLAEYLAQPYGGMGHHSVISRKSATKINLPNWLVDSPVNLSLPRGMSRGDFYEHHYRVDPKAGGFRLPAELNEGMGWRPKELGLTKYGLPERVWRGTPVPLKDAIATIPFADAPALYDNLERPQ
jgi:hypothetical protein